MVSVRIRLQGSAPGGAALQPAGSHPLLLGAGRPARTVLGVAEAPGVEP